MCSDNIHPEWAIPSNRQMTCVCPGGRSVAKGGPGGARAPPSVAKLGPGPPTFLRLCPYFAFDTRLAESAVDEDGYNIVRAYGEQKVLYLCAFQAVPVYAVSNPNCHENASWAPSVL